MAAHIHVAVAEDLQPRGLTQRAVVEIKAATATSIRSTIGDESGVASVGCCDVELTVAARGSSRRRTLVNDRTVLG